MHLRSYLPTLAILHLAFALKRGLKVDTSIGQIQGFVDSSFPDVKQWLGIPFAEPPVGPLRFLPPVAISEEGRNIMAQKPPASCLQYNSFKVFSDVAPEFLAPPPYEEDCLYLNVFAPSNPTSRDLPVLFWIHGGATMQGGINTPYERSQQWVQRSQGQIIVQTKLEWVRKNIQSFGGDPNRITAWGQSGGSAIIDALSFAYPCDPIFQSMILQSAVALMARSATEEADFMRKIDAGVIEKFIETHFERNATPPLYFSPSADDKVIFTPQQNLIKGEAGDFADVPAILGSNTDEGSFLVPFSQQGPPRATVEAATLAQVQCPVAETTRYRAATSRPTYRYLYGGNFTNISPLPWLGAYHCAEIPLVTGTYGSARGAGTPLEWSVSEKMQDLWLAFARDPQDGLQELGWPAASGVYGNASGNALVFARDGKVVQMEEVSVIDASCPAN